MDADRPRKPEAPAPRAPSSELQIRIVCAGRTVEEILVQLHGGLREALAENRDPLIVLEDLFLLRDSVSNLLKGICRELVGYPRTVSFWESTGITEAFLSVLEAPPGAGGPRPT